MWAVIWILHIYTYRIEKRKNEMEQKIEVSLGVSGLTLEQKILFDVIVGSAVEDAVEVFTRVLNSKEREEEENE